MAKMTDQERMQLYTAAFNAFRKGRDYKFEPGERVPMCKHCYMAFLDHLYIPGTQGQYKCLFMPTRFEAGCDVRQSDASWDGETYSYQMILERDSDE